MHNVILHVCLGYLLPAGVTWVPRSSGAEPIRVKVMDQAFAPPSFNTALHGLNFWLGLAIVVLGCSSVTVQEGTLGKAIGVPTVAEPDLDTQIALHAYPGRALIEAYVVR